MIYWKTKLEIIYCGCIVWEVKTNVSFDVHKIDISFDLLFVVMTNSRPIDI